MRIIKLIVTFFLTVISSSLMGNNTDYASKWNEVNILMDKPLLQDAQKKVDEIRVVAKKENDNLNILKCEIYDYAIEFGCEYNITSESKIKPGNANREEGEDIIIKHYNNAEKLLSSFNSPVDKACCELFMAKMLMNFIDVMERYPGSVPSVKEEEGKQFSAEELREMSHENIRNLIRSHVDNIIKSKETLLSTSSERYKSLFVNANDVNANVDVDANKECHPSVFDAMLPSLISFYYENIELYCDAQSFYMPIHIVKTDLLKKDRLNSLFADVINYHNSKEEYGAALSAELTRLQYLERSYDYIDNKTKIATLNSLINQYDGKTSCVVNAVVKKHEVMCSLIEETNYSNENRETDFEKIPQQIIEETEKYQKLYPNHSGIKQLEKNIKWLKQTEVRGNIVESCISKGKNVKISIKYANIDVLHADIYRINMTPVELVKNNHENLIKKGKLIAKKDFKLAPSNYKILKDTVINIGNNFDFGKYIVKLYTEEVSNDFDNHVSFIITDLSLLNVESIGDKANVFVVDGETGHPVKGATVESYDTEHNAYRLNESLTSTAEGKAQISLTSHKQYALHTQKDRDIYSHFLYVMQNKNPQERPYYKIRTITDRGSYRPGQTVEGKIILTKLSKDDETVAANKTVNLVFYDTNHEIIEKKKVVTNEYGSAVFKFVIPSDRLNGVFYINSTFKEGKEEKAFDSHYFGVESYKLPVAEAKVKIKDGSSIMYGSKLEFEGEVRTFSGEALGGTVVKYNVANTFGNNTILFSGETTCDDDGKFSIILDSAITADMTSRVDLNVEAVLPSGETVTTFNHVQLEENAISGTIETFQNTNFEMHSPLKISAYIDNNQKIGNDAEIIMSITTKEYKEENISSKTLISKNITGQGKISETFDISSLQTGIYEIHLKTLSGEDLDNKEILIYDKTSHKLAEGLKDKLWTPCRNVECTYENNAEILIASSEKNAKVLVVIRNEEGSIQNEEWIDLNNEQKTYKVSFDKYFANNHDHHVFVEFIMVREHQISSVNVTVLRKETIEKTLIDILEIERNIVPGEKQKIKMRVKPSNCMYEIAAAMVDKSLADILPRWLGLEHFHTYHQIFSTNINRLFEDHFYFVSNPRIGTGSFQELPNVKFLWDNICMPNRRHWGLGVTGAAKMAAPKLMRSKNGAEEAFFSNLMMDDMDINSEDIDYEMTSFNQVPPPPPAANDFSDVKVRDNFVETAFFYPQLTTAADGSVEFEYTAPDALTKWDLILFAHNKNVKSCITSEELQTQMPFAVKASLPRFVRKGDKCSFATTITNNDEKEKSGDVAIIIKDVATDKIISQQSRKFSLDGNKSKVEEWSFDVPAGVASIEVKMVGKSGTFSDGEVHQLPVLPDGTHVVKSKSMHVRGGETKDFSIDYNEKEMKDAELTVEYTDNAVWQSLMALPSIKDARYECATEFISSVYVNQMAQRIALLYPEIKTVVEEWQKEGDHAASPLDQNQELKEVLMKQTPWMCEAKSESEQRAKIVELYDKDRISKANKDAISKLEKLQQADGGFAWFSGFKSREYVTVAVAEKMVEMREYGVLPKECEKMLKSAVKYIDNALTEAYENEINKKWNADREWVFDVFRIRISYDKNLSNNTKKILDYYVKKAHKEIKEMTLFGKASFAIVLNMKGDVKEAKSIVESLRQSATNTEEFGMYWKGNQDSWGRYGNAIATHAMLTKAFMKTGCDAKELSDLRFHLITKKETTQWNNAHSTLAAIDALVGDRSNAKTEDARSRVSTATIKIGGKQVDAKRTSGDGYVKIHYNKDSFTPELCNIHVEQPQGQEGIGGIYISYDAPYSEITSGKSGIEIKKKMYKVVIANDGDDNKEMLQEIKDGEKLQKGDKVKIVMTLRSDRDIDFVQVLDLRAACLEPVRKRPGIEWADGKIYYQSITDSEYSMFFDRISKGTRVFEYTLHVTQSGEYTQGITKVIPHYCPTFGANSEGGKVLVK